MNLASEIVLFPELLFYVDVNTPLLICCYAVTHLFANCSVNKGALWFACCKCERTFRIFLYQRNCLSDDNEFEAYLTVSVNGVSFSIEINRAVN